MSLPDLLGSDTLPLLPPFFSCSIHILLVHPQLQLFLSPSLSSFDLSFYLFDSTAASHLLVSSLPGSHPCQPVGLASPLD